MDDNLWRFINGLNLQEHVTSNVKPFHDVIHRPPFMTSEQKPRRTFNPRYSRRYGVPTLKPEELVRYSPKYGYSRIFNFPYRGAGYRPRMNTMVLQIHGIAAPIHRDGPFRAAGGVFFGSQQNPHNHGVVLQVKDPQTNHRALLLALRFALQELINMKHTMLDKRWKEAMIMTNSEYVVKSFSEWVWQWELNGWQHIRRGGLIEHADVIFDCQNLMTHLEESLNMSVRFWKVRKQDIGGAYDNAKKTFDEIIRRGL